MKIAILILSSIVIILSIIILRLINTAIEFEIYKKNSIDIMEKMYEMIDKNTRNIGKINNKLGKELNPDNWSF